MYLNFQNQKEMVKNLISKFAETLTGQRHATKNPQY